MLVVKKKRKNLSKADRREQLLQAALDAFVRGGYHATHVSDIVDEAGVARGTFYLHFDSKHDVFAALVDRMLGLLIERPLEKPQGASAEELLASLSRSYASVFAFVREHRHLCRLLLEEAVGLDKGFREQLEAHYAAWHVVIAETTQVLADAGLTDPALDVDVACELVIGIVDRVTRRYLIRDAEPDIPHLARCVARFQMHGIG